MILRLVNNPSTTEEITLDLAIHVHQRIEEVVYKKYLESLGVPIAYLDSIDIEANNNLSVVDRSDSLPENSAYKVYITNDYQVVTSSSYTTDYPDILITDVSISDVQGNQIPLFWAHNLPANTTNIKIEKVTNTSTVELNAGFIIDTTKTRVYFNFTNSFNPLTGAYTLYFITATTTDCTVVKGLINPVSAVREATWEDVDSETGEINDDLAFYTKEQTTSGFTYYFSKSQTYYIRVLPSSLIAPLKFNQNLSTDGWFPRFSNGSFKHTDATSIVRHYSVPEYEDTAFFPSRPYFFDSSSSWETVTKKTIYIGRTDIAINETNRPLEIIISKEDGTPIYALTTKTSKDGDTYVDDINWSINEIASWDNSTGIVDLNIEIQSDWDIRVSYYYTVKEFLYTYTNLNPLYNDLVYNHYYVYYLKPDVDDRAIHHLVVRNDGIIVDCSDEDFALLIDGIYNPNTFIGMYYRKSSTGYQNEDWVTTYSVETVNGYQYLILSEVFFTERKNASLIDIINLCRDGDKLKVSQYNDALYRNPALFHSRYAATDYGLEFPKNNALVVRLSYSLLEDYGGTFTEDGLKQNLYKYVAAGKYILFEWDEEIESLSINNLTANQITLIWKTLGTGWCYKIYRSTNKTSGFDLITTVCTDYTEGSFIDSGLETDVYYYYIVPTKSGIDYPQSYTIGAEVR